MWWGFLDFRFIFEWKKHMDLVHGSWTTVVLVHGGLSQGWPKGCTRARPSGRSEARRLVGDGATQREKNGESVSGLTGAREALWQPGDGGEEVVVEALDAGDAWVWREEKEDGDRCGGGRQSRRNAHPGSRGGEAAGR
jgi:hypothetical protein